MNGILADMNCEGHLRLLVQILGSGWCREFWASLSLTTPTFADLELALDTTDLLLWQRCQQEELVLVTVNRNDDGPDSLEAAIRTLGRPDSLPVITIANGKRLLEDRAYAERAAEKLLAYLLDMDQNLGSGRLYIP